MASVENSNRYSALEMDDEGNFVQKKAPKKQAPKEEPQQQQQVQTEQKDRTRVSDRNRRGGRGGGQNNGEFRGRGGRGAHRGGYIQDGEKREFDRRGAPSDRPRGRARKGGVGLGRYDGFDNQRRNRPARDETDPTVEPSVDTPATDATATDATPSTDATTTETPVVVEEVAVEPVIEEEPDTSLTLDEFQAQQRAKVVDSDVNRQLRTVEINDKQWSKISKALEGKKKFKLNAKGEEVAVEEEERAPTTEKKQQKKQVLSLDEFVGSTPATQQAPRQERSEEYVPRGGRGGAGGEFRGRGRGRGGSDGGRGRGFGRGGRGRGGFRNPQVAIDDKNAFPDLSAAAKKN